MSETTRPQTRRGLVEKHWNTSPPSPQAGATELIILLTITLLLFGAKRIPQLARSLRVGSREFRKGISGTYNEQATEGDEPRKEETSPKDGAPVAARSSETEHVL
jgi:TatA/E family protein of Tat protein translocase